MLADFLSLPYELRAQIYHQVLIHDNTIQLINTNPRRKTLVDASGLFRANKTVSLEARSIFYGGNRFDFSNASYNELALFFSQVGPQNTSLIRHACISLLNLAISDREYSVGFVAEPDLFSLAIIRDQCPELEKVTVDLSGLLLVEQYQPWNVSIVTETLEAMETLFGKPSSPGCILECAWPPPSFTEQEVMRLGWLLRHRSDGDVVQKVG